MLEEELRQPFLPRVRMIWFFVVITAFALVLWVVRSAEQGRTLAAALLFTGLFLLFYALFSAVSFLIAFFLGATRKAMVEANDTPRSPFSDGSPPEQIIAPRSVESL
jgi:hypothetical protein